MPRVHWKVILLIALFGGTALYVSSRYLWARPPAAKPAALPVMQVRATPDKLGSMNLVMKKVPMSSEQQSRIRELADESTNPVTFRRKAMAVLSSDEQKEAKAALMAAVSQQQNRRAAKETGKRNSAGMRSLRGSGGETSATVAAAKSD